MEIAIILIGIGLVTLCVILSIMYCNAESEVQDLLATLNVANKINRENAAIMTDAAANLRQLAKDLTY